VRNNQQLLEKREVVCGIIGNNNEIEIINGLREGDLIINY